MSALKFSQIAVASDAENGETVYALSTDGDLYALCGMQRALKPMQRWWERVDLPVGDPGAGMEEK
jgi:hypothetical protein